MVLTLIPAVTLAAAGNVENITDMSAAAIETAIHNLIPDPPAEITVEVIGTAVVDDMVWLELPGNMTVRWGADISASEPFFDWTLIFIENEDDNYAANFEVIAGGRIVNDFGIAINAEGNINVIIDGGQVISFDEDSVTIYVFDGDLLIKNGVVFGIGECWCQIIGDNSVKVTIFGEFLAWPGLPNGTYILKAKFEGMESQAGAVFDIFSGGTGGGNGNGGTWNPPAIPAPAPAYTFVIVPKDELTPMQAAQTRGYTVFRVTVSAETPLTVSLPYTLKDGENPAAMKADDEYILTAKAFCGLCGTMMVGHSGTSKTGKAHYHYRCNSVIHKKGCDKKSVHKAWIERHVVALTQSAVLRDDYINRLADAIVELQKRENVTIPFLQKQLADVDKRIVNLVNSIEEGVANASVKNRLDELEAKKADLEISLAREEIQKDPITKEQIVWWISRFKDGSLDDPEYRKAIVDIFVNSVFLYDDKLVITFNWKDGTKTVTLAELEAVDNQGGTAVPGSKVLQISNYRGSHLEQFPAPSAKLPAVQVRQSFYLCAVFTIDV